MRGKLCGFSCRLALVAVALCAAAAHAEDCTQVTDAGKRLECFDRAAVAKPSAPQEDSDEVAIQAAVRRTLIDPASAVFGGLRMVTLERACLTVNARNSYGGYAGSQQVVVMKNGGVWTSIGTLRNFTPDMCFSAVLKMK